MDCQLWVKDVCCLVIPATNVVHEKFQKRLKYHSKLNFERAYKWCTFVFNISTVYITMFSSTDRLDTFCVGAEVFTLSVYSICFISCSLTIIIIPECHLWIKCMTCYSFKDNTFSYTIFIRAKKFWKKKPFLFIFCVLTKYLVYSSWKLLETVMSNVHAT